MTRTVKLITVDEALTAIDNAMGNLNESNVDLLAIIQQPTKEDEIKVEYTKNFRANYFIKIFVNDVKVKSCIGIRSIAKKRLKKYVEFYTGKNIDFKVVENKDLTNEYMKLKNSIVR